MAYSTPGVYVQEVPGGARPIAAVGTATAGFVGAAPDPSARPHEAVAISNWAQFVREFCGKSPASTPLSHAVYGFFLNGGSRCFVVNTGKDGVLGKADKRQGLAVLEAVDEVAIIAAPGETSPEVYAALLDQADNLGDRVAILDAPHEVGSLESLTQVATATSDEGEGSGDGGGGRRRRGASASVRPPFRSSGCGAFYFPWIYVVDPFDPKARAWVAPSGHIAGVWARTDAARGVHKAPANEALRGALNVAYQVTRAEQGPLNDHGVNVIRFFPDRGIVIWGARTVAEQSSEYRYLNVRRFLNMVKESIEEGTRWVVFEPNDEDLWAQIRRDVGAFLLGQWRAGALRGNTPEEAFFVKCDAETNPQDAIDRGEVITEIGLAPVKPAEFVIFRISQGVAAEEGSGTEA